MSQLPTADRSQPTPPPQVDLTIVARDLKLSPEHVANTVALLDEGNTISFITRFRKDQTGGLNENQVQAIKQNVARLRALVERKAFVLKSIESHGKLTDALKEDILRASSMRHVEDLYLPFKPTKQTRAETARQQGLAPLADAIFEADSADIDLAARATDYVRVDRGLQGVDDVIRGVGDLLVERFSKSGELRRKMRQILWNTGKLISKTTTPPTPEDLREESAPPPASTANPSKSDSAAQSSTQEPTTQEPTTQEPASKESTTREAEKQAPAAEQESTTPESPTPEPAAEQEQATQEPATDQGQAAQESTQEPASKESTTREAEEQIPATEQEPTADQESTTPESPTPEPAAEQETQEPAADQESTPQESIAEPAAKESTTQEPATQESTAEQKTDTPADDSPAAPNAPASGGEGPVTEGSQATETKSAHLPAKKKRKRKKKKKKPVHDPFKDYHDYRQSLKNIPHHRLLAINRGERLGKLKVKIEYDKEKTDQLAIEALVPPGHVFSDFLQKCAKEAANKFLAPSLEREIRRELTEAAETHAVEVFASNLRSLLLQPPQHHCRVLAIDPGLKRGCAVAVLDACGNPLASGRVFVVGNTARCEAGAQQLVQWIKEYQIDLVAIGNGAACRLAEQLVSDVITQHLQDHPVRYVMINEAGASTYSTSEIGREELPGISPSIRGAISIGRRLQDPLSELVKISPANLGVGMYQHDVKAKHLSESLKEGVAFCVNQVGVNVNTASPSLLRYVSGLNTLTARRLVEHRQKIGRFKNREQLKEVNGIGDATFVQAAGFLRVREGDNPLDATSIHPESYPVAEDLIARVGATCSDLFPPTPAPSVCQAPASGPAPTSGQTNSPPSPDQTSAQPAEQTTEQTTEQSSEQPSEQSTEQAALQPADQTTEQTTEQPSSQPAEPTIEQTAEQTTEQVSSQPVEQTTDQNSEQPAQQTSEQTTEQVSEQPTEQTDASASTEQAPQVDLEAQRARRAEVLERLAKLNINEIAAEKSVGKWLIRDILLALRKPDWDPRDRIKKPIFRRGIIKFDDLKPEMELDGQIVNVVDFGVFVDIGLGESSLVHISNLSHKFLRDPYQQFSIGGVLKVWVSEVDVARRRVKLTAIEPGSKAPEPRHKKSHRKPKRGKRPDGEGGERGRASSARYAGKGKGKTGERRSHARSDRGRSRPPKPMKPITDKMLEGAEPMRSFSDLLQFVKKKPNDRPSQDTSPKDSPKDSPKE